MAVHVENEGHGRLCLHIVGGTSYSSSVGGGQGYLLNPWGKDVMILSAQLQVVTASTDGAALDVGVAADAVTKGTDVISDLGVDGVSAGYVYNCFGQQVSAKTQISAPAKWQDDYYLTFTAHDASMVGFEGFLFLEVLPLAE